MSKLENRMHEGVRMNISVGTKNTAKIKAVQAIFPTVSILPIHVYSHVSSQPFTDEETRLGAINRAIGCVEALPETLGIGLEGGVMYIGTELFLCNWGALVTPDEKVFTASGARIALPKEIAQLLQEGAELGELMDNYAQKERVRHKEGAIGIFTNHEISRHEMFAHVVRLLKGQWLFEQNKSSGS